MNQSFYILRNNVPEIFEMPPHDSNIIPGVLWGRGDGLFSPAYWALQLEQLQDDFTEHCFLTGKTLFEETVFCLLGGHGISYELNVVIFKHLIDRGFSLDVVKSEEELGGYLREPVKLGDRFVKYRFPRRRASFIARTQQIFLTHEPPEDDLELRDWLVELPGIGPKTASWIVRNWLDSDAVAIIDIHLYRAGILAGLFTEKDRIERDYYSMEKRFINFANAMKVKPSRLDGLIWEQMRSIPLTVKSEMEKYTKSLN